MRLREFTIMEMEYFIDPEDPWGSCPFYDRLAGETLRIRTYEMKVEGKEPIEVTVSEAVEKGMIMHPCLAYWMGVAKRFVESIGVPEDSMFFDEKGPHERAHYSSQTFDQMVKVSRWGWVEVSGHSYRGDYDLSRHMKYSGADLTVFKPYDKPVKVKVRKVIVNRAIIGRIYRSESPKVLELVSNIPEKRLIEAKKKGEDIEVDGYKIPAEAIVVVEKEEKITGKKYVPHVVEPSFGTDRVVYVAFEYAYREKEGRTILSFPRDIAPVQAVVLPLVEKEEPLIMKAKELYRLLVNNDFYVIYDDSGSIGRRYARADEIGVPAAFTIDYVTLEDNTITMRDRDTWKQVRLPMREAPTALRRFIYEGADISDLGEPVEASGEEVTR